jgi:hypothetical protein
MTAGRVQWLLVLGVSVLLEIVLIAILAPLKLFGVSQAVRIPMASLVASFSVTVWFSRRIRVRLILHGLLIGIVATLIYMGAVIAVGGGIALALSRYGRFGFVLSNGLRIIGATMAGAVCQNRRMLLKASA